MTPENINISEILKEAKRVLPAGSAIKINIEAWDNASHPKDLSIFWLDDDMKCEAVYGPLAEWRSLIEKLANNINPPATDLEPGVVFTGLESAIEESAVAA